jgi:hypothetical protein
MWPVLIFGTGRCGSTHLQRLISLSTTCWIWGEHGGFLEPLLESVNRYENSQGLVRFVFDRAPRDDDRLVADMTAGSEMLSWVNELDKDSFRTEVRSLVDRMFRSRIPAGWTEWGFKEIRYGLNNNVPSMLLSLFPAATAIFTFRHPKTTIESMIKTWSPELLNGDPAVEDLSKTYRICATRYKTITKYFLDYRAQRRERIVFVSSDKLERPTGEILQTLGLPSRRAISRALGITNPGPNDPPGWARVKFDELFACEALECLELFARACARSDADFGVRGADRSLIGDRKNGDRDELAMLGVIA